MQTMQRNVRPGAAKKMESEIDGEMQTRIEQMIAFKKPKDRKQLLNNPPKKETSLKGSKDKDSINMEEKKSFFGKGIFGQV